MFYRNKAFVIEDVFRVSRKAGTINTKSRDFAGLAFRLSGESVFIWGEKYRVYANRGSITYIPEGIDFETRSEHEEIIILHLKTFGKDFKKIMSIVPENYDLFADLFCSIEEEWQKRKTGYKSRCTALLYTVFENLEKNTAEKPDSKTELIKNGINYMNRYFDKPDLTVKKLAEKCNVSEVYFRKIYKQKYGISPLKKINELRINRACNLLESGYYNVSQVAALSGFDDVKYFSTFFKKIKGVSPAKYVKSKKQ